MRLSTEELECLSYERVGVGLGGWASARLIAPVSVFMSVWASDRLSTERPILTGMCFVLSSKGEL